MKLMDKTVRQLHTELWLIALFPVILFAAVIHKGRKNGAQMLHSLAERVDP